MSMEKAVRGARKGVGGVAAVATVGAKQIEGAAASAVIRCKAEGHTTRAEGEKCLGGLAKLGDVDEGQLERVSELYDHLIRVLDELEEMAPEFDALLEAAKKERKRD